MISDIVQSGLRDGVLDKIEIGRSNTSKPLRLFLSLLEGLGFTTFPRFYFKERYKKIVPLLNEFYLKSAFNPSQDEYEILKKAIIHKTKAVFLKTHSRLKLEELHNIYLIQHDPESPILFDAENWMQLRLNPREIPHLDKLIDVYNKLADIRKKYPTPLFAKIVQEARKQNTFQDLSLNIVLKYLEWEKKGWIDQDHLVERIHFLNHSGEILSQEPWLRTFISTSTQKEMNNETPHTDKGMEEVTLALKIVDIYKESRLNSEAFFQLLQYLHEIKPDHFEFTLKQYISYIQKGYLKIEGSNPSIREQYRLIIAVGDAHLDSFFKLYYQHPIYLDTTLPLKQKIDILLPRITNKPEEVFEEEALKKIATNYKLIITEKEITRKGGLDLFTAWIDKFDQSVKLGSKLITEDPCYNELSAKICVLDNLREQLLVDDQERFVEAVKGALKGDEVGFWSRVEGNYLGQEYQTAVELYKSSHVSSPFEGSVEERIKKILPFARNIKEVSFLIRLYVFKRAARITRQFDYCLTESLKSYLDQWTKLFPVETLPVTTLNELDNLLLFSLKQVLDGGMTFEELLQVLEATYPKLSGLNKDYFDQFSGAIQRFRENKMWLMKEEAYYNAIVPRVSTRAFRAFLRVFIPTKTEELKPHFQIVENKYSFNDPCPIMLIALKAKNPGHLLLYFLELLKNRGLHDLLQKDHFHTEQLVRTTIQRFKRDLIESNWKEVRKEYKEHLSTHFPECFVIPYLDNFLEKVEKVRREKNTNKMAKVPPVPEFLLANLPTLIMALEALEGVKLLGAIGQYLLPRVLPIVLKLNTPQFTPAEKDAIVAIIGILLPDFSVKHDFYPLIRYMKELNSFITLNLASPPSDPNVLNLSPEDKTKIAISTLQISDYLITQVMSYKNILNPLLEELDKEIIHYSANDLPSKV